MVNIKINGNILNDIDTIIFDKDGTITNSHLYWGEIIKLRAKYIVESYNLTCDYVDKLCEVMGYSIDNKVLKENGPIALVSRNEVLLTLYNFLTSKEIFCTITQLEEIFVTANNEFNLHINNYINLLPNVREFLQQIKEKNIKIAIVTSDTYQNCKKAMDFLYISQYIDLIMGKDSTASDKVTGIPAVEAMKALKSDPKHTICIGDAEMDLLMSKNANCQSCILVATGQIPASTLLKLTINVVNSMSEIVIC